MAKGGKRKGAGRLRTNTQYTSIQIPTEIYHLLILKKGNTTWKTFFLSLLNPKK